MQKDVPTSVTFEATVLLGDGDRLGERLLGLAGAGAVKGTGLPSLLCSLSTWNRVPHPHQGTVGASSEMWSSEDPGASSHIQPHCYSAGSRHPILSSQSQWRGDSTWFPHTAISGP